jgi:histidinol phosphatase-like PHP family hydrolase
VPDGLALDALELSPRAEASRERWGRLWSDVGLPLIASSDAHRPTEVGAATTGLVVASASVDELRRALRGADGRGISV